MTTLACPGSNVVDQAHEALTFLGASCAQASSNERRPVWPQSHDVPRLRRRGIDKLGTMSDREAVLGPVPEAVAELTVTLMDPRHC
jgi:hypothetical protein